MKTKLIYVAAAASVLFAAAGDGWALPPRQHTVSGVIDAIDFNRHAIALTPNKGTQPLTFVWNDSTRFSHGWSRICLGALEPGQPVVISYRREIGQLVPREVKLRKEIATQCTTGECNFGTRPIERN